MLLSNPRPRPPVPAGPPGTAGARPYRPRRGRVEAVAPPSLAGQDPDTPQDDGGRRRWSDFAPPRQAEPATTSPDPAPAGQSQSAAFLAQLIAQAPPAAAGTGGTLPARSVAGERRFEAGRHEAGRRRDAFLCSYETTAAAAESFARRRYGLDHAGDGVFVARLAPFDVKA